MSEYQAKAKAGQLPENWIPLSTRDEKYEKLKRDFMRDYESSLAMANAKEAGYEVYLRKMVYSMVAMQAAIIAGLPNIPALDAQTIDLGGIIDHWPLLQRMTEDCRMQASNGEIAVYIPNQLIDAWIRRLNPAKDQKS